MCSSMSRKWQPSSLENLSIDALKNFYDAFLNILIGNNRYRFNESRLRLATQLFERDVLSVVPYMLADKVFGSLEEVWKDKSFILLNFEEAENELSDEPLGRENIRRVLSESIKSLLLNLNIKLLCLDREVFVTPILQTLTSLPQLEQLDIFDIECLFADKDALENLFVEGLKCLPNLKVFTSDQCTDKILREISRSCLELQQAELTFDRSTLSRETILEFSNCKKLKSVCLSCCSYPAESVATLISSLPCLEEVYLDNADSVLDALVMQQTQCCVLKEIGHHIGSNHLKTVNELCPQIRKLNVNKYTDDNLNIQNKFQFLHKLEITDLDFSDGNVLPFFQKVDTLKCLKLIQPKNVTERAFRIVAESCPKLEKLVLYNHNMSNFSHNRDFERFIQFPNLLFLLVIGCNLHEIFFSIRCPSLKRIVVAEYSFGINTCLVEKFLDLNAKNHFIKLCSGNDKTHKYDCYSQDISESRRKKWELF